VLAHNGGIKRDPLTGEDLLENPCGRFKIAQAGSMTVEEFDTAMADLTSFLAYVAEPMALERKRMGIYALLFLAFFGVFAYLLNREYWKDVH
jgi:ubiquinol-cytochrome c reductase cytochrome b subunit